MRPAKPAEASELAELVNSVYRADSHSQGWKTESHLLAGPRISAAQVARLLADPDTVLLTERDERGLTTCVQLERHPIFAYLGLVSVRLDLQGQGRARQVLAAAENYVVRQWGVYEVRMTVIGQRGELIDFYERAGYRRTGEREPFDAGDVGRPLVDDLYFEVLTRSLS